MAAADTVEALASELYRAAGWQGLDEVVGPPRIALTAMPPRAMAAAVEAGALDAGPLPLAEVLRLGDRLVPVGDFCIATRGRVDSVLLLSSRPVLDLSGRQIEVTSHTATSIQLLRVLFADHWHVTPGEYVENGAPHAAKLVIGDEALRLRKPSHDYPYVYDLSTEWEGLTGLPFVFAVWSARASVPAADVRSLATSLEKSLDSGLSKLESFAHGYTNKYMSEAEVIRYVRGFIYRLTDQERNAIEEFKTRLSRLPVWRPGVPVPSRGG